MLYMNLREGMSWCVLGDFNKILNPREKQRGNSQPTSQIAKFRAALKENRYLTLARNVTNLHGAMDIKMALTIEKLDIVVVNLAWKKKKWGERGGSFNIQEIRP